VLQPAGSCCLHHGALDNAAARCVFPQGDEEFSRQCDDHRLTHLAAGALDALLEPEAERRGWLMSQP
jgi:hypothetical protein